MLNMSMCIDLRFTVSNKCIAIDTYSTTLWLKTINLIDEFNFGLEATLIIRTLRLLENPFDFNFSLK